ncbi:hypothetical protein MalM25_32470 [Planctomycetes bacterium MalM25]|nr:hypothetical protein MalM25_32470 [Planctomycetes bacterium MalM25]
MPTRPHIIGSVLLTLQVLVAPPSLAEETRLFDGKSLGGWSFHQQGDKPTKAPAPWFVQRGMLISSGTASGYLIHKTELEDYVLTFQLRTMTTQEGNGMAIGSLGSVYLNAVPVEGAFNAPKSIEVSLRQPGDVFFRDLDEQSRRNGKTWAFRAPRGSEDAQHEMGEWNRVKLISHGKRLTVVLNDRIVNQVDPINRTRGAVAIRSDRGFAIAPTFYRDFLVRPVTEADRALERTAAAQLTGVKRALAEKAAAEKAEREAAERLRAETQNRLAKVWSDTPVAQEVDFKADVTALPYPAELREIEFDATFDSIEFESPLSLSTLSEFYRTEMARRGWRVVETDIEEDEVTVVYRYGKAEVELNLDESSDGVDVSLDCEKLSFDRADDPAALVKIGVPQPQAYLFLQHELQAPQGYRGEEYEDGESRSFKSTLPLPELYEFLTKQLRQKGYRETRRPIVTKKRRYSEFVKGGREISVNAFKHKIGSRVEITLEED